MASLATRHGSRVAAGLLCDDARFGALRQSRWDGGAGADRHSSETVLGPYAVHPLETNQAGGQRVLTALQVQWQDDGTNTRK